MPVMKVEEGAEHCGFLWLEPVARFSFPSGPGALSLRTRLPEAARQLPFFFAPRSAGTR